MLSNAILLFLILDPFGNIPLFTAALRDVDPARRGWVVRRELLIALAVLLGFLAAGRHLLAVLKVSGPALTVAGGILLFLIAIRMVFPSHAPIDEPDGEPLIVPLAIPLTAGPSALATVLLIASGDAANWPSWVGAVLLAWFAAAVLLTVGSALTERLGKRGLTAIERLMGMLLIAIAVEMFLGGVTEYVATHDVG